MCLPTFLVARPGLPIWAGAVMLSFLRTINLGGDGELVVVLTMAAGWRLDLADEGKSHARCALVLWRIWSTGGLGVALRTFLLLFFCRISTFLVAF